MFCNVADQALILNFCKGIYYMFNSKAFGENNPYEKILWFRVIISFLIYMKMVNISVKSR